MSRLLARMQPASLVATTTANNTGTHWFSRWSGTMPTRNTFLDLSAGTWHVRVEVKGVSSVDLRISPSGESSRTVKSSTGSEGKVVDLAVEFPDGGSIQVVGYSTTVGDLAVVEARKLA